MIALNNFASTALKKHLAAAHFFLRFDSSKPQCNAHSIDDRFEARSCLAVYFFAQVSLSYQSIYYGFCSLVHELRDYFSFVYALGCKLSINHIKIDMGSSSFA